MAYIDRVAACHVFDPSHYIPFVVDDRMIGQVHQDLAERMARWCGHLQIRDGLLRLSNRLATFHDRTAAMAEIAGQLRDEGRIKAWRDEPYAVREKWGAPVLFNIERGAVPSFGFEGYGVHMNGFVGHGNDLHMWIGKRSPTKPTAPGKLDQMVAGGLPAGIGVMENLVKEAAEEADIPEALARQARPVGAVTYCTETAEGLRRDVLFNFDLEVPAEFQPKNTDGEIEAFFLWPVEKIMRRLQETDDFKFNCAIIVIDFLIRRGFIGPDEDDYVEIIQGLNRKEATIR